jgi:L-ribulose-5-phosphate 3-epimerase
MNRVGIMQGRLVPPEGVTLQCFPRSRWADEFDLAAKVPLDYIEWIYDSYGAKNNPLTNNGGIQRLKSLIDSTGVGIRSICADYFMEYPLVRCKESVGVLSHLIRRCNAIGAKRIVLPFVDNSAIAPSELGPAVEILQTAAAQAAQAGIELHIETSLPPRGIPDLLRQLPESIVKVNYDSGNSASLGYAVHEEFAAIGSNIGSVHIKDRVSGGGTVPLGSGNADFAALFEYLRRISYDGDFTLQVARSKDGDEVNWARHNFDFLRGYWAGVRA